MTEDPKEELLARLLAAQEGEELTEQPPVEEEPSIKVLAFEIAGERYAVEIDDVAEIVTPSEPAEIPLAAAFLDGIVSWRGHMVPLVNGRKRLGHPNGLHHSRERMLVFVDGSEFYGLLVDAANQVVALPVKEIRPVPPHITGKDAEFVRGVCEYKARLLILLNTRRLFDFTD